MKYRRLICPGARRIEVDESELGPLPDDGVLVQQEYTAVSAGTEIYNWIHGSEPGRKPTFPRQTGYCGAGTVLEVGRDVAGVKPGDRLTGQGNHGSHTILTTAYQKVPSNVSSKAAALMVMGAVALRGIRVANIKLGESVAIIGLGLVGQLAATLSRLAGGFPVIAIDVDAFRLEKAEARSIDVCLNPHQVDDLTTAVRKHCPDVAGANVVIEATGKPQTYPTAVKIASDAGRIIGLGSPRGKVSMDFFADVHLRELTIQAAFQPYTPEQGNRYYPWTLDRERNLIMRLMSDGRLPVEDLVSHVAKPEQCQEIYTMLADRPRNALGVLFEW